MHDYSILDALSDGIMIVNRDYTIIFANRTMLAQCRMTAGEIAAGQKCHQLLHGCPVPCAEICLEKKQCPHDIVFQTGLGLHVTHHHTCPSGDKKNTAITASPLVNEKGEVDRLLLVMRDVTADEEIREKAERDADDLRNIFNSAPFAISYVDCAMRVLKMNPAMEKVAGLGTGEAQGRYCYDMWGRYAGDASRQGKERICDQCGVRKALADGRAHRYEREIAGRYYEVVSSPVRDNEQSIVGSMEIGQDITARRLAEISMRRYKHILSTTDDLLSFIDTNFSYRTVNDAYCRAFNKNRQEIEGHSVSELLGAELFESAIRGALERCLRGETVREEFSCFVPGLDMRRHMDVAYYPFFEADGSVSGIVANARDISRRKQVEERVKIFAERKNALHNLTLSILEAITPEEIGVTALAHLRRLIPCSGCCIALFDLGGKITRPLAVNADITPPFYRDNFSIFQCDSCMKKLRDGAFVLLSALTFPGADTCSFRDKILIDGIRAYAFFPLTVEGVLIGALSIFHDRDSSFSTDHLEIAWEIAAPVAVAIHKSRLNEALARHGRKLQEMTLEMAEIEDNERRGLARQLHDEAGQRLTSLGLNLDILYNDEVLRKSPELRARLDDCVTLVEQITEQTRNVMADLRPPVLDDYGLGPALRWYCQKVSRRSGLPVVFREEAIPPLPRPLENTLFGIAREAISNAVNHGCPGQITLSLRKTQTGILLRVEDDGRGFMEQQPGPLEQEQRWGLISMRERIAALGGRFEIQTLPGQGTIVLAEAAL
ncbi:MAG: PAS domain-containing protein [Deltaproteobacteria bacterium]|nr:PAS domain-containing protein [Deltaproteobacteria bacterium]